ncbi:major facilitator superfamily domain-containing protein [Plectosphaerella cucumerina]|uniref:Major facilitator superfamily domain-containing protein n=1 Tax=Plectosphaerella cucumerina TaxID=40658 RepID=A0A8K0TMS9_9PEZI|nr:major facilitator superfamily domain-containing protein [Plectosphaerella cucumerina]
MLTMVGLAAEIEYPEGGLKAWLVVLGAWCALASGAGWLNSMGVLMAWISQNQLRDVPESTTAWIFSLYGFALYFCGAQIGPIFDAHDIHLLTIPGSIGMATSIMGLSRFSRRRSLATGIALSAGGLGGVFYPLIILYLGPAIGFPWAVRDIGFFNVVTGVVGCLLVRKRLPPNKAKGAAIELKALREPTYAVVTLASFLLEFTLVTPYTFISTYAIAEGMDPQKAYMLTTILSAAGFPGRIVPNYFADRYGVFNVMTLTAVACIASIFGLWLNAHRIGDGAIIAFAVLWGFWSGASIALAPVCIGETCETEDYGKRTGTAFFIASFGALMGPPIAGAILDRSGGNYLGGHHHVGGFTSRAMTTSGWMSPTLY